MYAVILFVLIAVKYVELGETPDGSKRLHKKIRGKGGDVG